MNFVASISPKSLGLLASDTAVDLFRELLWAEANRAGIGPALVSVPSAITVSDGGVDAEIAGVSPEKEGGLLGAGATRYQIKTGAFSAGNQSELRDLFLKEKSRELKDRIRSCFAKNGTFVVVLFGSDTPDRTDDQAARACQEFVGRVEPAFRDCPIRVISQNQLAGLLSQYPSLADKARLRTFPNLRRHSQWRRELESLLPLRIGEQQKGFIDQVRSELRKPLARHLCVWGEPGIGKTRLLYEATKPADLSCAVAYFGSPKSLDDSGIVDELVNDDSKSAIVVVDDCDSRDRETIWRQLKGLGTRVRLVTVQHDPCESSGTTVALQTPELAQAQISEIIQQYGVEKSVADRFAEYCGGSPRVGNVVGWNLQNNPNDPMRPLDTGNVWNRFIEQNDPPSSDAVVHRKLVLQYLALFKKFGYGEPYQNEARFIAGQVAAANPQITWARFQEIILGLRRRRIVQGESTLYITPKLLHIKLWSDWWELYGPNLNVEHFLASIPDTLHAWFYDMFAYDHGSRTIRKTVRAILGTDSSFFREGLVKTRAGANFFLSLTEADTEAALDFLEATIGKESRDELGGFSDGRQRVVWALEKIAVERPLFQRAARVLLRLAEAENEPSISNNATGTFAALFSLGPGKTAPTQAPPAERMPVLEEAISSTDRETRAVALRAFDAALKSSSFRRAVGAERRGLKDLILWSPDTDEERLDAYRAVWRLLSSELARLPEDQRAEALRILLKRAFELLQIENLADLVTSTVREVIEIPGIPRKAVLETALDVLDRLTSLPEPVRARWGEIRLTVAGGDSLRGRLRSQLVLPAWRLASDSELTTDAWRSLAEEAIASREEFLAELPWLVTNEPESAGHFGYEVGRLDHVFSLETPIIEAVADGGKAAQTALLGGYLRAVREANASHWLATVRALSKRPDADRFFPAIVVQSGLTDEASDILTDLIEKGVMPGHYLLGFGFGGEIRNLSPNKFASWISLMLSHDQQAAVAALQLLHHYVRPDRLAAVPPDLIEAVLLNDALLAEGSKDAGEYRDYDWAQVAEPFLCDHPDKKLTFARKLLESMGRDSIILKRFRPSPARLVLTQIAKEMPSEVWAILTRWLGPPIDFRAHAITDWLQGGMFTLFGRDDEEAALDYIPHQDIWAWVDQDIDKRAWYLASFAPKLDADGNLSPIARALLVRYGDRDDVRRNLIANYSSGYWRGPMSSHYAGKMESLEHLLENEPEPRIREWLNLYIGGLRRSTDWARTEEEREDF